MMLTKSLRMFGKVVWFCPVPVTSAEWRPSSLRAQPDSSL